MTKTYLDPLEIDSRSPIAEALARFVETTSIRQAYFADSSVAPLPLAYVTSFPRMAVPLSGNYPVKVSHDGGITEVTPAIGDVIFVAKHCWDKPTWEAPVEVLTLLFGRKQIGLSLVAHDGSTDVPVGAMKASIPAHYDDVSRGILDAMSALAEQRDAGSIGRLLAEALLHTCLRLLASPQAASMRKASHTYDAICLYVQEHYQEQLTRDMIAQHFDLHPSHVSRLFRTEGHMRFTDYLTLVRIERAKLLLRNYDMAVKEVAVNCGFMDTAYFCRVFRQVTKVTPIAYRLRGL
jgi:AraC-like DNA-binding protein